jgi:hypothetical protein
LGVDAAGIEVALSAGDKECSGQVDAIVMARNCSAQVRMRTRRSPP